MQVQGEGVKKPHPCLPQGEGVNASPPLGEDFSGVSLCQYAAMIVLTKAGIHPACREKACIRHLMQINTILSVSLDF